MTDDQKTADEKVNGAAIAAEILNAMPADARERLMQAIGEASPNALGRIKSNIVSFDDIPSITTNGIQVLIREMHHQDVVLAVATGHITIKEVLLKNMSTRKARAVVQDASLVVDPQPADVRAMEKRFVSKIDELRKAGIVRTEASEDVWV